jgi:4'-phosphopantetheinyl transferase
MNEPMSPESLATGERNIDIWLTYYDEIVDAQQLDELRALLTPEEVSKEGRFLFTDDRKRYLVTRAMVRMLLSRYAPVEPARWEFSKNAYGRPWIANATDETRGLIFNISHTRGLIALAVTRGRELGVDVENVVARKAPVDIAERFFSPVEVAELSCIPAERQQDRFFEYWTFKEAYIKARGMGLSLPLDRFSFDFPHHGAVRISIQPDLDDHAERWSFWQCRPTADYVMAICAERGAGASPRISMRKFNPLIGEQELMPEFLKTSGDLSV